MNSLSRLFLIIIIILKSHNSFGATINSASQTTAMSISNKIDPGTSGGTIILNGASTCGVTGTVKNLGTCTAASFLVSGTSSGGSAVRRQFRVIITPSSFNLTSGANTMSLAPSLATSGQTLAQTFSFAASGNATLAVPVYGTLTVSSGQATGNYSGTYTFYACTCPNTGCATNFNTPNANCTAGTVTGTSTSRVATPVSVIETSALNFGVFAPPLSGSGTITSAGAVTGGVMATSFTPARSAGIFAVSGESSTIYNFNLPASVSLTGSGPSMTANLAFASGTSSRTLSAGGAETVTIDGTLTVPSGQTRGSYSGTYTVTVAY